MNFSDETINAINQWATIVGVACGLIAGIAGVVVWVTGDIKDNRNQALINLMQSETANVKAELIASKTPRYLTKDQQEQLTELASPFAGQHFRGMLGGGSTDALTLWETIAKCLIAAGWIHSPDTSVQYGNPSASLSPASFSGVTLAIEFDASPQTFENGIHLKTILEKVGVQTKPGKYMESELKTMIAELRRKQPNALEIIDIQVGTK